jgi:hypothetical protein
MRPFVRGIFELLCVLPICICIPIGFIAGLVWFFTTIGFEAAQEAIGAWSSEPR